jgi:heterodisulfide reductase subunit A-like polyferredoxin
MFFMDMRTFGKDFDKYNLRAQDDHGVRFVRSRIHSVYPAADDQLRIVYATEAGSTAEERFDLVVLSVGSDRRSGSGGPGRTAGGGLNARFRANQRDPAGQYVASRDLCVRRLPGAQGYSPLGHGGFGRRGLRH